MLYFQSAKMDLGSASAEVCAWQATPRMRKKGPVLWFLTENLATRRKRHPVTEITNGHTEVHCPSRSPGGAGRRVSSINPGHAGVVAVLPELLGGFCRLRGLGGLCWLRSLQLGKGFLHALPEVSTIVVLKPAIVRLDLHLALCAL